MNKAALALLATLLIAFASYNVNIDDLQTLTLGEKNLQQAPPKTVPHVDLDRYMGVWHEIAAIPAYFERGCEKTYQKFSRTSDGKIKIDNVCDNSKGVEHDAIGYAFPDPKDPTHSNAKLKLKMPPYPGQSDFWIVRLDDSYSYAVTSSPDYRYLWVWYRSPIMPEQLYQDLYKDLEKDGFHVQKLRKTIQ